MKNPVLMSLIVASTSEALVATGFATFLPKLIENQFGKTSSFSATLAGNVAFHFYMFNSFVLNTSLTL